MASDRLGLALVAYAGTGKDTFCAELAYRELRLGLPNGEARWLVYMPPDAAIDELRFAIESKECAVERFAFADALKVATHSWLKLVGCPAHAFEAVKNTMRLPDPTTGETKTIRGHYIDFGQAARRKDPLVWAAPVAKAIADYGKYTIDVTTDWRFENELAPRTHRTATIRLYRSGVPVAKALPNRENDSEHNLDNVATDYLLVPPGEFEAALKKFPQYANYISSFGIHK